MKKLRISLVTLTLLLAAGGGNAAVLSAAPAGSPADAVVAAMLAQSKAGPYRTKTTTVTGSGTIHLTGEMIPPDRIHTVVKGPNFEHETVTVGDKSWSKQGGAWTLSPVSGRLSLQAAFAAPSGKELASTISDAKTAGTDKVNGEEASVYTYTATTDQGAAGKVVSAVRLWVSLKRGLPIKQEIAGEAGGVKSTTVQTIEYDPAITIAPPM